jgi:hypothetical protein
MTQLHLHRLIHKDPLKQLPLQLIPQLRLRHLPVLWLLPRPRPPVLLPQLALQLALPVEWVADHLAVPAVAVDHRLPVMAVDQRVWKVKIAKTRERLNL